MAPEGDTTRATRPQAYHAGIATFMQRPGADLASLRPGMTAVWAETTIRLAAQALFQFPVERAPAAGGR